MSDNLQDLLQTTAGSFNFATLLLGIGFSIVGWGAWRYGRKSQSGWHMIIGVALMVYPYFVSNPWWSFAIGSLLTGFLFWL